jgi:hypothetical protein
MCTFTSDKALVTHWQFDVLHRFIGSHLNEAPLRMEMHGSRLGTPN